MLQDEATANKFAWPGLDAKAGVVWRDALGSRGVYMNSSAREEPDAAHDNTKNGTRKEHDVPPMERIMKSAGQRWPCSCYKIANALSHARQRGGLAQ